MRSVPWVAGMLRPDVEGHALGLQLDVDPGVGRLGRDVGRPLPVGDGSGHRYPSDPAAAAASASALSSSLPGMGSTSTSPGHGLTRRASSGKSLRSG